MMGYSLSPRIINQICTNYKFNKYYVEDHAPAKEKLSNLTFDCLFVSLVAVQTRIHIYNDLNFRT